MAGREVNGPSLARLASFPAAFGAVPPRYPNAPRHVNMPQCSQRGGLVHPAASHYCSPVRPAGEVVHPVPPQYFRASQVSEAGDASEVRYPPGCVDGANWTGLCLSLIHI